MRKLYFYLFLTAFFAILPVFALVPGEKSGEYKFRIEWINCSPMPLGKINPEKHRNIPDFRAVVFFYTRSGESDAMVSLLENARRSFNGKLLIAIITPDNVSDAEEFSKRHPDSRLRMAVDMERKLTPAFMQGGGMILPTAFLMDKNGKILWRGEAADLPEAAEQAINGKLDTDIQQKTAVLTDRMHQALANGNMLQILRIAEQIFAIAPGHPAALRMAVFAAESTRREQLAWELTMKQHAAAKHLPRITFTALELILRHRSLQSNLPALITDFDQCGYAPRIRYAFADALLRNFPYRSEAVIGAKRILESTPLALQAAPEEMAMVLSLRARLFYALGDLDGALENQSEAVQIYRSSGDKNGTANAEQFLKFFQDIKKESPVKK